MLSDLFVFPSFYKGYGLPILETMACEAPVLISNQGGFTRGDRRYTSKSQCTFNVQDIVAKIHLLLTNSDIRNKNIQHGINRAKTFTLKKTAQETLKVYDKILEPS